MRELLLFESELGPKGARYSVLTASRIGHLTYLNFGYTELGSLHLMVPNHGRLFKSYLNAYVPDWQRQMHGRASRMCGQQVD